MAHGEVGQRYFLGGSSPIGAKGYMFGFLSSEKLRRELPHTPRPIEPTLGEPIEGIPGGSRWSVARRAATPGRPIQEESWS